MVSDPNIPSFLIYLIIDVCLALTLAIALGNYNAQIKRQQAKIPKFRVVQLWSDEWAVQSDFGRDTGFWFPVTYNCSSKRDAELCLYAIEKQIRLQLELIKTS